MVWSEILGPTAVLLVRRLAELADLQERGCTVTIATAAPTVVAALPQHRRRSRPPSLGRRRSRTAAGPVVAQWVGDAASLRSTLTGDETPQTFDWLVLAGPPVARTDLSSEPDRLAVARASIGDTLAARTAAAAILDGRRAALAT